MDIKLLNEDKEKNKISLLVSDSTPAFVNALRRTIIESVPTIAIEDVEFRTNSSVLYDEVVALRLGLISLKSDLKSYNETDKCTCEGEGCAKCSVDITLSVKGPATVYASDLKSKDPAVVPVYPETPIAMLLKGQEMELTAKAIVGTGKNHAKWVPAFVFHQYEPIIKVNNNSSQLKEFKSKYPPQIFDGDKIDQKKIIELGLVDAVAGINEDIIKVEYNEKNFILTIESFGQLSLKEIFQTAVDVLKTQSDEFVKALK